MKQIYDVGFYDRFNIIGYDYPFNTQKINRLESHFHFGLDRDSITTILPIIQNTKCLAVLSLPSTDWSPLERANTLNLSVNGEDFSFQVYREDLSENQKNLIKNAWKEKKYHVIIYSNYIEEISFFFEKCNSSSICLFLQHADILQRLVNHSDIRSQFNVYLCNREYSRHDFTYHETFLRSLHKNIKTELLLLDRFQFDYEKSFNPQDKVLRCVVIAESEFNVICRSGRTSTFKNVELITKVHNDEEFDFHKKRHNYLTEGVYHFFKLLVSNGYTKDKDYDGLIDKFICLQGIRTIDEYDDNQLHNLFHGKTREALNRELVEFGIANQIRIEKLYKDGVLDVLTNDLISCKEKGLFPNEVEFYSSIPKMSEYNKCSKDFIELWEILDLNYLPQLKKLFISYSFKDSSLVKIFYERFVLMGVDVRIYENDNPLVFNKVYMNSVIRDTDVMMFIASKNSLISDACHFELTQCIEIIRRTSESERLIVVRLDDYVLNVDVEGILDKNRVKNILFLKNHASLINRYFDNGFNLRNVDKLLKEIVDKALRQNA